MVTNEWEQLYTDRIKYSSRTEADNTIDIDGENPRKKPFKRKRKCYKYGSTDHWQKECLK